MCNTLQKAAAAYRDICRRRYSFTFSNDRQIEVLFKPQNFVHLAGLRKLNDINEFQDHFTAINIFKMILQGKINDYDLQRSVHYDTDARERILFISEMENLLHTRYAVWDFDPKKGSGINTRLKSKVILFRNESGDFYLLLGLAPDGRTYYPETFFLRFDDAYIRGQDIVKITSVKTCSL